MDILQRWPPVSPARSRLKAPGYLSSRVWRGLRPTWVQPGRAVRRASLHPRNNIPSDSRVYQPRPAGIFRNNRGPDGSLGPHSAGTANGGVSSRCCPRLSASGPSVQPLEGRPWPCSPSAPRVMSPQTRRLFHRWSRFPFAILVFSLILLICLFTCTHLLYLFLAALGLHHGPWAFSS